MTPRQWYAKPLDVVSAREVPNPWKAVKGATRPKRLGLAYEKSVARKLIPYGAVHGMFFEAKLRNGEVFRCSPDILLPWGEEWLIIEIKLSAVDLVWEKLRNMYEPVVRASGMKVAGSSVIFKHLRPGFTTNGAALAPGVQLQWLGGRHTLAPRAISRD